MLSVSTAIPRQSCLNSSNNWEHFVDTHIERHGVCCVWPEMSSLRHDVFVES
jgi:hypothetical protein